jgi:hypothetical protein
MNLMIAECLLEGNVICYQWFSEALERSEEGGVDLDAAISSLNT